MIRARESMDPLAVKAHFVLDKARGDRTVPTHHVTWALSYLGDAGGSCRPPSDLGSGYDHRSAGAVRLWRHTGRAGA